MIQIEASKKTNMAIIETVPSFQSVPSSALGELACRILISLDNLTLGPHVRVATEFDQPKEYEAYLEKLRFKRGLEKEVGDYGHLLLPIHAANLQQERHVSWDIIALRTDKSSGTDGVFDPEALDASYALAAILWKLPRRPGDSHLEVIGINGEAGAGWEPTLHYQDCYPGITSVPKDVETDKVEDSYQFGVFKALAAELEREVSALDALYLDEAAK